MSERRACKATGFCRMTMRYRATRGNDASLRERMKAIARERRRFGYRRLHVLLRRKGFRVRVARELDRLLAERGRPKMIVSDNVLCCEGKRLIGQHVSVHKIALVG